MTALARLAAFQRVFSTMLRTPLDRSCGALCANVAEYPRTLCAQVLDGGVSHLERLATYHRQYWFRMFGVLQGSHPLTTALLGPWELNGIAADYLRRHPPRGHELAAISDGFSPFVIEHAHAAVPRAALQEAAAIDAAFHRARTAPGHAPLRVSPASAHALETGRLVRAPSFSLVTERWPLVAVRQALPSPLGEHRVALPAPHATARSWLIGRSLRGIEAVPLQPVQATLLELLTAHPLGDALAILEERHASELLVGGVQRWLGDAIERGLWMAVERVA